MTAVQALREPKAERLIDEPEETHLEWYRRWCRESTERQRQKGLPDESPLTMEEIVAVCKEVRAEMYEEEQKIANNR